MLYTILIPVVTIAVIFVVFYLFKDKFQGKFVKAYDDANKAWAENKEGVIAEMFSNPDQFKMIKEAVGEAEVESICPAEPKKGIAKKLLKGVAEVAMSRQSFDMSLYYLVIAGGEMHLLQSDGKKIVSHDAFTLGNMSKVDIRPENAANKVMNVFTANDAAAGSKDSIFFESNGEEYSYKLLDVFQGYPKFEVEKGYSGGKYGQNPFYRIFAADQQAQTLLGSIYGPQTIATFREAIERLK